MMHKLGDKIHQMKDKMTHHDTATTGTTGLNDSTVMDRSIPSTHTTTGITSTTSTTTTAPTTAFVETRAPRVENTVVEKPVVVNQQIQAVEKEVIQPVIHREREQTEIHRVTQPLHQREIQPTQIHNAQLAPEVRATIVEQPRQVIPQQNLKSTSTVLPSLHTTQVNAPVVEETIKKNIIHEVQPVLQREVIQPHIIQEVKPIYEKIVEAPVIIQESRPVIESRGMMMPTTTTLPATNAPLMGGDKLKVTDITTTTQTTTAIPNKHHFQS